MVLQGWQASGFGVDRGWGFGIGGAIPRKLQCGGIARELLLSEILRSCIVWSLRWVLCGVLWEVYVSGCKG